MGVLEILAATQAAIDLVVRLRMLAQQQGATNDQLDALDIRLTEAIERRKAQVGT